MSVLSVSLLVRSSGSGCEAVFRTGSLHCGQSLFRKLDEAVDTIVRLDCIGGFVVTQLYGLERPTSDLDVIELATQEASDRLMALASQSGPLHRKYRIYLDRLGSQPSPKTMKIAWLKWFQARTSI